jgi:putative ABC transport system permease protein
MNQPSNNPATVRTTGILPVPEHVQDGHGTLPGSGRNKGTRTSMFWRLWWRALTVKHSQAALALSALVVGAAISAMLLTLYGTVRRKMTEDFRSYGANVIVSGSSGGSSVAGASNLVEESALKPLVDFVQSTPGVTYAPVLYGVVRVSPDPADPRLPEFTNAVAAGTDLSGLQKLNPGWHVEGQEISGGLPPSTCAVGSALAAQLHLRPGSSVKLHRVSEDAGSGSAATTSYRVAAILTTGASEDNQVMLPLPELQALLGISGQVSLVELSLPGETRDVEGAVHRLTGLLPGLEVRPIRQIVYSEGKVLDTIRWLLLSLTILILVIITLCVMATMTAIVLERRKDIGIMKALGAADGLLTRLFMAEGAGLGLAGGILGYGIGALLAREVALRWFGVGINLNPATLLAVCGLAVLLAMMAGQVPVRIVKAMQPTVVLKGE